MKSNDFATYLSSYFLKYMPLQSGYSDNTIKSYRDTFIIFLRYSKDILGINPEKLNFTLISKNMIIDFLIWLEIKMKSSISTRNQRLAALHSFFRYVQIEAPEYMETCNDNLSIRSKKTPSPGMNYLSVEAIKELLASPNMKSKHERRDLAVLALLYDTGARVQEVADLVICDIRIKIPATIQLTGKGNKTRIIPLMPQTMNIIKSYMLENNLLTESCIAKPLFYNKGNQKLTRAGISYILNKYVEIARKNHSNLFPSKVTPHVLRRSKAMHLLERNVNLIYIRDFLGHASVTTTEIYAKSNPEVKRKAIEHASPSLLPDEKYTKKTKQDLLDWLKTII
ncbi:site-specific integrase [Clostridium bowmanii]|uniref:site-specific integrase n=1 Tax=Clostridium bowmanii TaxID=132925 RepID=UPI001C0C027F|nr:site-specific integrase [Clostridium bowmanii]MBU3191894.1 site-specific integrase [Clostridium bowmanii]MCA1076113.1 site-specific integrase [Clostridium bowmanii]